MDILSHTPKELSRNFNEREPGKHRQVQFQGPFLTVYNLKKCNNNISSTLKRKGFTLNKGLKTLYYESQ